MQTDGIAVFGNEFAFELYPESGGGKLLVEDPKVRTFFDAADLVMCEKGWNMKTLTEKLGVAYSTFCHWKSCTITRTIPIAKLETLWGKLHILLLEDEPNMKYIVDKEGLVHDVTDKKTEIEDALDRLIDDRQAVLDKMAYHKQEYDKCKEVDAKLEEAINALRAVNQMYREKGANNDETS